MVSGTTVTECLCSSAVGPVDLEPVSFIKSATGIASGANPSGGSNPSSVGSAGNHWLSTAVCLVKVILPA